VTEYARLLVILGRLLPAGIAAGIVVAAAVAIRLAWRRGKGPSVP